MKKLIKIESIKKYLSVVTLGFAAGNVLAVNPVPGFYAGIMLGVNFAPDIDFNFKDSIRINPKDVIKVPVHGTVFYSSFGNLAGQLGYRCNHYRIEGEFVYNDNPIKELKLNGKTYNKISKFNSGLGIRGKTDVAALMVNGFYDFYTPGQLSYFSPYVGVGIGYAKVMNEIKTYDNNVFIPALSQSNSQSSPAGQAIIGLGYFLDDFTSMGLDFRYLATKSAVHPFETRTKFATINVTLNGSFDRS